MRSWSRRLIFAVIVCAMATSAAVGAKSHRPVFDDALKQLFWLLAGVLLTTFILEALLSRDLDERRKREVSFGFRVRCATVLALLMEMVTTELTSPSPSLSAVVGTPEQFAEVAQTAAASIERGSEVVADEYNAHYLDISQQLQALANNFVRVFSRGEQEMVEKHWGLLQLANHWTYRDELTHRAEQGWQSAPDDEPGKLAWRRAYEEQEREALVVVRDTAKHLAELARLATRPGLTLST